MRARIADIPGVQAAGFASYVPLGFMPSYSLGLEVEGYTPQRAESLETRYAIVSPGYLAAMRIPVLSGRDFTDQDDEKAESAIIVNEALAKRYWPGQDPIGRRLRIFDDRRLTVVGVVQNGRYGALNEPQRTFLYLPYQQGGRNLDDLNLTVVLRARGNDASASRALRVAVREIDPVVRLWTESTLADHPPAAFLIPRVLAAVLVILGALALALASTQLLSGILYGVSPFDESTFVGVAAILGAVTLLASYLPARRAARVDPLVARRGDRQR